MNNSVRTTKQETNIRLLAESIMESSPAINKDSTLAQLCQIAISINQRTHADSELSYFSKKYDISGKLYAYYNGFGVKINEEKLDERGLNLFANLLYYRVHLAFVQDASAIEKAIYINVCWKIFADPVVSKFTANKLHLLKKFNDRLLSILPDENLQKTALRFSGFDENLFAQQVHNKFTTIPIDILFYEGPIARAYLSMLHSLNLKPRRIIHLIPEKDIVSKKKVGVFLPHFLREKYAFSLQKRKIHYWPQRIFKSHKQICSDLFRRIEQTWDININTQMSLVALKPLEYYADEVVCLSIDTLKDMRLVEFFTQQDAHLYLFTGGGILPRSFFEIKNVNFLHIHPGYLPDIRGADCLLWSTLLSGQPSATCFFMDAGIDTGEVVTSSFLSSVTLPPEAKKLDSKTLYRLLYSFLDPWVRASVLRTSLQQTDLFSKIATTPQSIEDGSTFHFMSLNMKDDIINELFISDY